MKKLTKKKIAAVAAMMWTRGICTNHTGKMEGMTSISTSCKENEFCKVSSQIKGSVCEKCYAQRQLEYFPSMINKYKESTMDLTSRVLSFEELPTLTNDFGVARLESFGELNNEIQVVNYFSICRRNPDLNIALWTKRPELIKKVIDSGISKPENLNIIVSTLMVNGTPQIGKFDFVDGYFTVYTLEYSEEHNIKINCGLAKCLSCLECYDAHDGIFIINELLK